MQDTVIEINIKKSIEKSIQSSTAFEHCSWNKDQHVQDCINDFLK